MQPNNQERGRIGEGTYFRNASIVMAVIGFAVFIAGAFGHWSPVEAFGAMWFGWWMSCILNDKILKDRVVHGK